MVYVDVGEFIRGSEEYIRERPVRKIYLDAFKIGKYPVTNQEFKAFIEDGGYENKELWAPEGWQWRKKKNISGPFYWHERKWNCPNFPVVGVSWYEASAYAKWLSRKTVNSYCLPTEVQWEKAARGSGGFLYPWGDEWDRNRCNSEECGLNRTSPVGIFPIGASPYGCMDMAGNVWEWCADWFNKNYYIESPGSNPQGPFDGSNRVIRGGSWIDDSGGCRAAGRDWIHPTSHGTFLGFRLARLL
jgi:formylglycine-generating enzyme required for sulfatase activity